MFGHATIATGLVVLASTAIAKPVDLAARTFGFSPSSSVSFNGWHGISSLDHFDNFYGSENFDGSESVQVFQQSEVVVCETVDITVIQQQLAVIVEFAKRVITQQICEVETQVITLSQVEAHFSSFSDDIRRESSHHVSFDSSIASHISSLVDSSGNINTNDFGFSGSDIGQHSVFVEGDNWNPATSPASVGAAFNAVQGL